MRATQCADSMRGTFSTSPPPVMCAYAMHFDVSDQVEHARYIDACRFEQRIAKGAITEVPIEAGTAQFHHLPYQRVAVRVQAARSEADHCVTGDDPASVDDAVAFDDPYAEPGEIVVAFRVHPRHLGALPPHQGRTGDAAAFRDSANDFGGNVLVDARGSEVVQEEERFRSRAQDVVHAHRHQVDSCAVVAAVLDRDRELGAHPVRTRYQHRASIPLGDLEQGAEAPDPADHFRASGRGRQRSDALHEAPSAIDVHARGAVGQAVVVVGGRHAGSGS